MLSHHRRCLGVTLFVLIAVLSAPAICCAESKRLNVLLIVCDDLNTHVTPSGYEPIQTPAMDRLAASGMTMTRAYCQYPVCGPSRASFLSGLYPESTGVLDNKTDIRQTRPKTASMPELFQRAGYWTGGVGKVFHGRLDHAERAWEEYHKFDNDVNPVIERVKKEFEAEHGSIDKPANQRPWRLKLRSIRGQSGGQTPPGFGPTNMTDAQHKDGKNARQIVQWLDNKSYGEQPFFLVCGIHKPHVPFWAPQKYFDAYPLDKLVPTVVPTDDWNDIPQRAMVKRFQAFGFELGRENDVLRRQYMQAYHACISFIDAQIGLMLEALERTGVTDETIVVLTSDHGYHLGEHFMWGKVTLFEECARVPLIVRLPDRTKPGSRAAGLVELVDLFPTLVDVCQVPCEQPLQGRSFVALLDDHERAGKKEAYTVVTRGPKLGRAIRTDRWRYAEWDTPDQNELYDLNGDPSEHRNLANDPEFTDVVAQLRKRLGNKQQSAASEHLDTN